MAKNQTFGIPDVLSRMVLAPKLKSDSVSKLNKSLGKLDAGEFFGFENIAPQIKEIQIISERETVTAEMAKRGFPELDYTFLAWRKKVTKLPAFMVLDLNSNQFTIKVEPINDNVNNIDDIVWSVEPLLPEAMLVQFEDSIIYMAQMAIDDYDNEEIAISAQFKGVMPKDIRKKTKSVFDECIFGEIFVICEAPDWTINKTGWSFKKDPLVVGWIDKTDQMFLIASFDITSLEDYVLTQFKK